MHVERARRLAPVAALAGVLMALLGAPGVAAAADAPFVSAHRGGAAYAPENTLVAFDNAVRLGVDELEADVQLTGDGRLVVVHDDTLDRTTDCSGTIAALPLADVRACDAAWWFSPGQATTSPDDGVPHPLRGTGVRIPTGEELLDLVAGLDAGGPTLSIEIKDVPGEANFDPTGTQVAEVLVPAIVERGITDRVVVQSFWPPALDAVERLAPDLATQLLTTSQVGVLAAENVALATTRGYEVSAPNHDAPDLTADLVATAQGAGVRVVPWTPDRPDDLAATVSLGVDGIITNVPACLLTLLGRGTPDSPYPRGVTPPDVADVACPVGAAALPRPPDGGAAPTGQVPDADGVVSPPSPVAPSPGPSLPATGGGVGIVVLALAALAAASTRRTA